MDDGGMKLYMGEDMDGVGVGEAEVEADGVVAVAGLLAEGDFLRRLFGVVEGSGWSS